MKRKPKKKAPVKRKRVVAPRSAQVWPEDLPVGAVTNYAGDDKHELNGTVVRIHDYNPQAMLFICYTQDADAEILYLRAAEIEPLTKAARAHVNQQLQKPVVHYDDSVYDLRDALAHIGIYITAESVNAWTPEQRGRISVYATVVANGGSPKLKPKELGK